MRYVLTMALMLIVAASIGAQTIVTERGHFRVHHPPGARETAKEVAAIAEEVWYQLVTAYDLHDEFRPIDILITDDIDIGNGYADYYQNRVVIWATHLNYHLRGSNHWLRDVVAHEVAHVFSLKLARLYPFRYGLIQGSVMNSGTADIGLSLPVYSLVTPGWWVEGIAQYESKVFGGDSWDTHRDMLLRMATLEDDLLSYDDMGVFAHNWLKSEMVYNQGFALTNYIAEQYGPDAPRRLAARTGRVTFNTALREVTGRRGPVLYREWKDHLETRYEAMRDSIGETVEGAKLTSLGSFDWSPVISPDGTRLAWVSNHGEDYLLTEPRILHMPSGQIRKIDERIYGNLDWFPSGDRIVYSKFGRGTLYLDLYVYDLASDEERRITSQLRARDPAVSPDGEWIAFVSNEDGGNRLGMVRSDGSEVRWLTNDRRSEGKGGGPLAAKTSHQVQMHTPRWSPDGKTLIFSIFRHGDRDIATIGTEGPYFTIRDALSDSAAFPDTVMYARGSDFRLLVSTGADERDPVFLPDGSGFLYSADYGGVFNVYRYDFAKNEPLQIAASDTTDSLITSEALRVTKLTNVLGGAFVPHISPEGDWFAYVSYHASDFSVYSMPLREPVETKQLAGLPEREYRHIEKQPSAEQLFRVGQVMPPRTLVGWVPSIRVGPNFIGDEFTVNHVGVGMAAQIDDMGRGRTYYAEGEITKNLQAKDPPSLGATVFAAQALPQVRTTEWILNPSVYAFGSFYRLGVAKDYSEVLPFSTDFTLERPDGTLIRINPVASNITFTDTLTIWDNYTYKLGGIGAGFGFGRNRLDASVMLAKYQIEELVDRKMHNYSQLIAAGTGQDVTYEFPWALLGYPEPFGKPLVWDKQPQFRMLYYDDMIYSVSWSHSRFTPTADGRINPTAGHALRITYRFHNVTVSDSLTMSGLDADGDGRPNLYDPVDPVFRSTPRKLSINEIVASWRQHIRMPGPFNRHTLALYGIFGYMDQPLKYYDSEDPETNLMEGWAYWPLRYRLGGAGTLRGYPYFSHEGSKFGFFRVSYVFPLIKQYGIQFLHMHHDRTYAALFIEGGSTWNWERLSEAKLYTDDFLWDIGVELRTSMFTFYRLPLTGYAIVARRMADVPLPFVDYDREVVIPGVGTIPQEIRQPDRYRLYFGLTLGLGGGGHNPAYGPHTQQFAGAVSRPQQLQTIMPAAAADPDANAGLWAPVTGTPRLESPPARYRSLPFPELAH